MEKSRPVRNRRNSRKTWAHDSHRPAKRLFTPEIKRMLKDWLVRRRENPYPSRDEKKSLAVKTGLTYIQVCNWFANWRRKLKNTTGSNRKKTWGNLIKNYNYSAKGNVEQFSISSRDSIWEEELENDGHLLSRSSSNSAMSTQDQDYNSYYQNASSHQYENDIGDQKINLPMNCSSTPSELLSTQCFQITSTNGDIHFQHFQGNHDVANEAFNNNNTYFSPQELTGSNRKQPDGRNKYKSHIIEKYLRGLDDSNNDLNNNLSNGNNHSKPELTKWIISAENFTPSKNSYLDWDSRSKSDKSKRTKMEQTYFVIPHEKDELEAAEALTRLASNFKHRAFSQRMPEKSQLY